MRWLYVFIFALFGAAIAMQAVFLKAYYAKVPTATRVVMIANIVLLSTLALGLAVLLAIGRL